MAEDSDAQIRYEVVDAIATITLNRPDKLNALVPSMGRAYGAALRAADADPDVRAIVVTGAGRGFCAGADLAMLAGGTQALTEFLDDQDVDTLPTVALRLATPVVTAINGPTAGIGFVMAIAADVRFASPTATMSTSFARLGLVAEYGAAWLLTRLVGLGVATDILLTGRTITGVEAHRLGLVTHLADDPLAAATAWARDVADACSPTSIAVMKQQLLGVDQADLASAVVDSLAQMRASFARPDLTEAVMARVEQRPPSFGPVATPARS